MVLSHRRHSAASNVHPSPHISNSCLTSAASAAGNRSSADDSRDYSTEDETIVDAEQGNGATVARIFYLNGTLC
jgi:hypothetical protein